MLKDQERKILDSLKSGERTAMKRIFSDFHPSLCRIACRLVGDEDDAKDMVQDVFLKLWTNRESLSIQTSLSAYLKRAVINTCLNFLEKHKKTKIIALEKADLRSFGKNDTELGGNVIELSLKINQALERLPSRTKAVFSLIRFEEMTYKEVADSLDISTKAVEKEMMKALRMLRDSLRDYLVSLVMAFLTFF